MGKANKCTVSQLMVRNWAATGAQLPQLSANQNSHLNDFLNCYCKNEQERKLNYHVNYTSDEVASPSKSSFTSLYLGPSAAASNLRVAKFISTLESLESAGGQKKCTF